MCLEWVVSMFGRSISITSRYAICLVCGRKYKLPLEEVWSTKSREVELRVQYNMI